MATAIGTSEIAKALRYLMRRDGITVSQLSVKTAIPVSTLYAMLKKSTNEADIANLKRIAEAFDEGLDIFCGVDEYVRPIALSAEEEQILRYYRGMDQNGRSRLLAYAAEVGENPRYLLPGVAPIQNERGDITHETAAKEREDL